ncbi:MAG: hypothetical protein KKC76_13345 [Proteobacteria bacterium]|nr:hypothetical protein [Pseudomonadota bacterium]MBU4296482.1 hypothetical protein [Pseudomonadota bacterium]MCG2749664.1 hypothetical protein [Desulfobulbaceae bacterium]
MSALIHLLSTHQRKNEKKSIVTKLADRMSQLSEAFWFTLSLCLFVIMGPFSIFAVIIGLHTLATKNANQNEPESV